MTDLEDKNKARVKVADLVSRFKQNESDHLRPSYNETQARTEFITPFLEAFGWDVHNLARQPSIYRDVVEEATVGVAEERLSRRPDYELRIARQRKLFVEAKKPSVKIDRDRAPAFQTRRYGYSASLPICIVTNFRQIAVYDCQPAPSESDEPHVARILLIEYDEFERHFDDLWDFLSKKSVASGNFDRKFSIASTRRGAEQFDDFFLSQVRKWRELLAFDIAKNTPDLSSEELTYVVQLFLSRIIFLRICEDRNIEKYETLKKLSGENAFEKLSEVLRRSDKFYNSGLFNLLDNDELGVKISDTVLSGIFDELYYPQSPYTFSVVETEVLGEIYEQFLGEVITVKDGSVEIVSKPEVRESGGVVPTPAFVADSIVEETLGPALYGKGPKELLGFTVADICCGSGIFLLSAYDFLLGHFLDWYVNNGPELYSGTAIYEFAEDRWALTFEEKRRILLQYVRGVDVDPNAVEVAQFSLLLKLIEDESEDALVDYIASKKKPVLPSLSDIIRCGNSLVSPREWRKVFGDLEGEIRDKINPFDWDKEFEAEMQCGGFHVVVGNPPYIRIQRMVSFSPEEVDYYHNDKSPYKTAKQDNYDKYALFIERSLYLVKSDGRVGLIVPHKFMSIQSGRALRELLVTDGVLEKITHFGVEQVFGKSATNYTCILLLDRSGSSSVALEKVGPIEEWRYGEKGGITTHHIADLSGAPWDFSGQEVRMLFQRVRDTCVERLASVANIHVGLQTSADKIYIFEETRSSDDSVFFHWKDEEWEIERNIIKPCLYDSPLQPFSRPKANAWMIFPYEITESQDGKSEARLIQPDELQARYPLAWAYLSAQKDELSKRNVSGGPAHERQWYQYGRSQSLTKFHRPKIILPVLSREARYAYDESQTLFTGGGNGPYYMLRAKDASPVTTLYLLAVLNHPLSEAMVRTHTSIFRGGYYSHGKQFIGGLPIPTGNEEQHKAIENLSYRIVVANDDLTRARTPHNVTRSQRAIQDLRNELEALISEMFGLTEAELDILRSVPVPS